MSCEQHRKKSRSGPQKGQEPDSDASPLALDVAVVVPNSKQMQKKACSSWCLLFFWLKALHMYYGRFLPRPIMAQFGSESCVQKWLTLGQVSLRQKWRLFTSKNRSNLRFPAVDEGDGHQTMSDLQLDINTSGSFHKFPQIMAGMVVQKSHMVGKSYERWDDIGWIQVLRFIYIDLPDTHLRTLAKIIHNKKNKPAQWRNMPPSSSLQAMLAKKETGGVLPRSTISSLQGPLILNYI